MGILPFSGYKTYFSGFGLIIYGIGGLLAGKLDANQAFELLMMGLGILGIGHKVDKASDK